MDHPFKLIIEDNGPREQLEIVTIFSSPISAEQKTGVTEVVETFYALSLNGGCSGNLVSPGQSLIFMDGGHTYGSKGQWIFKGVKMDPSAINILVNMLHWACISVAKLSEVTIRTEMAPILLPNTFPGQWPRISFELEIGDMLESFPIELQFLYPQTNIDLELVNKAMGTWFTAANRGAYADDNFAPDESLIFFTDSVMDVTENSIIWFIDVMRCNDAAIYGLINILEHVHCGGIKIKNVLVDMS